jgi:precorrin-2 dehydrogenase/sirohydrochlorin ferrochelatase
LEDTTPLYPAFLNLKGRLCVVFGGGKVAERKVAKLLAAQARVRVISPAAGNLLLQWAADGQIEWVNRSYASGDAAAAWLVFAATNDPEVNRAIAAEAEAAGRLVNVADDVARCAFTVPASTRQGGVQVAISTFGTDPAKAKRLRELLESDIQDGTARFQAELAKD